MKFDTIKKTLIRINWVKVIYKRLSWIDSNFKESFESYQKSSKDQWNPRQGI